MDHWHINITVKVISDTAAAVNYCITNSALLYVQDTSSSVRYILIVTETLVGVLKSCFKLACSKYFSIVIWFLL